MNNFATDRALNAGWISEALFDLTSFPTEVITFNSFKFNSEVFWARLLSFQNHKFIMGASCPVSGDGLVGSHAYSILRVAEVMAGDIRLPRQQRITEYFGFNDSTTANLIAAESMPWLTSNGAIRLLKLRNPWGTKEWTGDFSPKSSLWTAELRKSLEEDQIPNSSSSSNGVFWISYHDFLQRFYSVDVCFAHDNWFSLTCENKINPSRSVAECIHEIKILEPTWMHISICQPTKRGKANEPYFYSDLGILILKMNSCTKDDDDELSRYDIEDLRLFGPCRVSHVELMLGEPGGSECRYIVIVFSIEREIALCEESRQPIISTLADKKIPNSLFQFGAGGRNVLKGKGSPAVSFSLRFLSSNPIMVCSRIIEDGVNIDSGLGNVSRLLWEAVERALFDAALQESKTVGTPIKVLYSLRQGA